VVAAAALRRLGWPLAAAAASACLAALAFHGQRPEPGLARFQAAGLMLHLLPERVSQVEVEGGGKRLVLARGPEGRWTAGGQAAAGELASRVETGLKLLHVSGPERSMAPGELRGIPRAEFGLAPPALTVTARSGSGPAFTVHFGATNPLGLARYARVEGTEEIVLLPGFVAEAWEQVAGLR
jgi:hypothetical protein